MKDEEMAEEYAEKQNLQNVNPSGIVRCKIADGFLAGLQHKVDTLQGFLDHDIEYDMYKTIQELRKENAELKELKKKKEEIEIMTNFCKTCKNMHTDQLIKAREIINKFTEFVNNEIEYDPEYPQEHTDKWNELCKQAEQFLGEVK